MNLFSEYRRFTVLAVIISQAEHNGYATSEDVRKRLLGFHHEISETIYPKDIQFLAQKGMVNISNDKIRPTDKGKEYFKQHKKHVFQIQHELDELE